MVSKKRLSLPELDGYTSPTHPIGSRLPMSLYRRSSVARWLCATLVALFGSAAFADMPAGSPRFLVSFPKERSAEPLDGRILLLLSTDGSSEPRMQISISYKTQMV